MDILTVKIQAQKFMEQIQTRDRNPVKAGTVASYQSHLVKWILPNLGDRAVSEIRNGAAKEFIKILRAGKLKAQTVNSIFMTLKLVIASAVNEDGDQLYPVKWNPEFIDLPVVVKSKQDTPTVTPEAITEAICRAFGSDKALYALCAGTGLRIGEALTLKIGTDNGVDSFWFPGESKLVIRTTLVRGKIQNSTKTLAGTREIDLPKELNAFLVANLPARDGGLVFQSTTGGLCCQKTVYNHLVKAGINEAFHAFRRFRITFLRKNEVPRDLIQLWAGHGKVTVTDGYSKYAEDVKARQSWTNKIGLGFELFEL